MPLTKTQVIFRCRGHKGCGRTFRRECESNGMNFHDPIRNIRCGSAYPIGKCECGRWLFGKPIRGKLNAKVKCDGRCMSAKGPNCECSCGGKNHGANWG